jgi:hypothetical protein
MPHINLGRLGQKLGLNDDYQRLKKTDPDGGAPLLASSQSPNGKVTTSPEKRSKELCETVSKKGLPTEQKIASMKELIGLLATLPGKEASTAKKVAKAVGNAMLQDEMVKAVTVRVNKRPMFSPHAGAPTITPFTKVAFFATEQKRAFDAILTQLTPVKQLANMQTLLIRAGQDMRSDLLAQPRMPPQKVLRSIEHRTAVAPLWGDLFSQLQHVKPERQVQAIKMFNEFLTQAANDNEKERKALAAASGDSFLELAKACDDLHLSAQAHVYSLFGAHYERMTPEQKKEVTPVLEKLFPELVADKTKQADT